MTAFVLIAPRKVEIFRKPIVLVLDLTLLRAAVSTDKRYIQDIFSNESATICFVDRRVNVYCITEQIDMNNELSI
jgi:hypothetical protein